MRDIREHDVYIGDILLPVTPSKITTKEKGKNKILDLLNGDELNVINKKALTEFDFEFLLPFEDFPSVGQYVSVDSVLNQLKEYKTGDERTFPFMIIRYVPGLTSSIIKLATLEDYEVREDTKNGRDYVVRVTIKEYIPLKTKKMAVKETEEGMEANIEVVSHKAIIDSAVVQEGETLSIVAKKTTGNTANHEKIRKQNNLPSSNHVEPKTRVQVDSKSPKLTGRKMKTAPKVGSGGGKFQNVYTTT